MDAELLRHIAGGSELVEWFGYAPRFHDAEVLGLGLDREGATCSLRIHGFEITNQTDAEGFYVCTKHAVVTFFMSGLTDLSLEGFNHQNALMSLTIERGADQEFRLNLEPAYGLGGSLAGRTLTVSIEPGRPRNSPYR